MWIIDGSGSMLDEIIAVQENITNFANMISSAGIDHHVVMLATDDVAGPREIYVIEELGRLSCFDVIDADGHQQIVLLIPVDLLPPD